MLFKFFKVNLLCRIYRWKSTHAVQLGVLFVTFLFFFGVAYIIFDLFMYCDFLFQAKEAGRYSVENSLVKASLLPLISFQSILIDHIKKHPLMYRFDTFGRPGVSTVFRPRDRFLVFTINFKKPPMPTSFEDCLSNHSNKYKWVSFTYKWATSKLFLEVWSNELFLTFLLVKHDYIGHFKYPLTVLLQTILCEPEIALRYLCEYYYGKEYAFIVRKQSRILSQLQEKDKSALVYPEQFLFLSNADNISLIETHFSWPKGTIKPLKTYLIDEE